MPRIAPNWQSHEDQSHPHSTDRCGPYSGWHIADDLGFTTLGVTLERVPPGSKTSYRHWHAAEDEMVLVLTGELVLVEDTETPLGPGDVAAWKAGDQTAHCLENRSDSEATILVAGARLATDTVTYPDHDLILHREEGGSRFTRLDGSPAPRV